VTQAALGPIAAQTTVAGGGAARRSRFGTARQRREWLVALTLIAPVLVMRAWTGVWPIIDTAWISLHRSNPTLGPDVYIGLRNYRQFFDSAVAQETVFFTLFFTIVSTIAELIIGLGIALLLNSSSRIRHLTRPVNLIPWAIPVVVTGIAFRFAFDGQFGHFTDLFYRITGREIAPLLEVWPARLAVVFTNVWRNAPFVAIILLAALQTIPDELYEAARIDGANAVQTFRAITFPLILPIALSVGVFFLIWQIATFDLVLAMTGGGPGKATQVLGYQAYLTAFGGLNFGYGAAISMVLMAGVAIVGIAGGLLLRRVESWL
jgi:multiple sugar transport system permease protein